MYYIWLQPNQLIFVPESNDDSTTPGNDIIYFLYN